MPKNFKNMDALARYLRKKVSSSLENEVAAVAKSLMHAHVEKDVSSEYTPLMYERRGSLHGGLGDIDNMETTLLDDTTLMLINNTPPNHKYRHSALRGWSVAKAVELGEHYQFSCPPGPRPFTHKTAVDLYRNKQHITALKAGLRRQGLNIK